MTTLKGLSWGHRRATGPLQPLVERFCQDNTDIAVEWTVRPLSDFEHQGLAAVAEQFDLIIYDHPFSGDVVASGAFVPLDRNLAGLNPSDDRHFAGASLTSYRYADAVWGAPIDGATQHALYRGDLMADRPLPVSWDDVLNLGRMLRKDGLFLGMACETPHAVLTIAALMANAGKPWSTDPKQPFRIDRVGLGEALELVTAALEFCPPEAIGWNSIDLHDQMVARDDVVYAPCVYGYATYGEADMRKRLSFAPFPGTTAPHQAGTAIGGTAVGLSRHCKDPTAALRFIAFLLSDVAQREIIAAHHGQPAIAAAWDDAVTDARFNGFFSAIRSTIDTAWIRPRLQGYPNFQKEAGIVVRRVLAREIATEAGLDAIMALADKVNR
ncbi:multiple sugar transport system substrate-binding protein [Devosia sp. UYZn731]|uniref:ABC transporter substrate-binding protein n=1 Tax=Devosia sp. UYZn731 TaxID=3156345 RepID=UPI00339ABF56